MTVPALRRAYARQPLNLRYVRRRFDMKDGIHPNYREATITCACGSAIPTKSVNGSYSVEICSQCHPFFTGKNKLMDTAGRVERFNKKYGR
jgi:large subunit ribosomal protein L31